MGRLETVLMQKKRAGKKLLLPFLTGNFPDRETFVELLLAVEEEGADAVEVGLPFSDPSADGPVIQRVSALALARGATVQGILDAVREARGRGLSLPLLTMTYYNPVLRFGPEAYAKAAAKAGVDGVLVVDLPPEEADEFAPAAREAGLDTVFLVAPTTPPERLPALLAGCRGFVYCVSVTGVTGAKQAAADTVGAMVARLRPLTDLPALVGFGVNDPASARAMAGVSDGVIVGSALLTAIGDATGDEAVEKAKTFVRSLAQALQ